MQIEKLSKSNQTDKRLTFTEILGKTTSFIGLVVVFLAASIICVRGGDNLFLSLENLANVARSISENGIIAIGMTLVILLGGIDLSVGAIVGLTATAVADLLVQQGMSMWASMGIVLLIALAFGMFNGVISTKLGIQPFIVTLASMSMARGLARFWSGGIGIPIAYGTTPGTADPGFSFFASRVMQTDTFYGIPAPVICFFVVAIIFSVLLKYTRFGRYVYAIGGNETSAFLSGIKVDRIKIVIFMLCGLLAGFAGCIHAAQLRQGSPNDGNSYELNAIAAAAIGGTSMAGGKGTIIGAVVGAFILGILDNMLGLKNVNNNLQMIVKGLIIIIAVVLQRERKR